MGNSRGPVCVGPHTPPALPPLPLLPGPHDHPANTQGPGSCPMRVCPTAQPVPWHSHPGPLPRWMVQSPGAGRESAHKQGEPSQALAVLQGVAGSRNALSSWSWFLSFWGDFVALLLAGETSEQAEPPHSCSSGARWLCSPFLAAETHFWLLFQICKSPAPAPLPCLLHICEWKVPITWQCHLVTSQH